MKTQLSRLLQYKYLLTGFSFVGLTASFLQTYEKINLLKNPNEPLSCDINPVVDCGAIFNHELSSVFGPPNSMIAMVVFSLLLGAGIGLIAGVKFSSAYKKFIAIVATILLGFSFWFYWVSIFVIGKVCIFCIFMWPSAVVIFFNAMKDMPNTKSKDWTRNVQVSIVNNTNRYIFTVLIAMFLIFLYQFRDYYFG